MDMITHFGLIIIGFVFILGSVTDVLDYKTLQLMLQRKRIPYDQYVLPGAIALKVTCGLALIFNTFVPVAAFLLAGFTLVANVIFHNFWTCAPADRKREYFAFMVHMAIIGGLMIAVGK